jgi:hypothetical protein
MELFELASLINSALSIVMLALSTPQKTVGSRYGKSLKSWTLPKTLGYCSAGFDSPPPTSHSLSIIIHRKAMILILGRLRDVYQSMDR